MAASAQPVQQPAGIVIDTCSDVRTAVRPGIKQTDIRKEDRRRRISVAVFFPGRDFTSEGKSFRILLKSAPHGSGACESGKCRERKRI